MPTIPPTPPPSRPPLLPSESGRSMRWWLIGGVAVVLIVILGLVAYFMLSSSKGSSAQPSDTPVAATPTDTPFATATPLPTPSDTPSPTPSPAPATIEIRNGTHVAGLAQKIKDKLTKEGFTVSTIGNAADKSVTKTMVYDLTVADADIAQKLAKELSAGTDTALPKGEATTSADILIILGTDAAKLK